MPQMQIFSGSSMLYNVARKKVPQSQWPTNCLLFHVILSVMKVTRAHVHSGHSGIEQYVIYVNRVAFNEIV